MLRDGAGLALRSRIVDGDVEPSEPRHGSIHQAANVVLMPNIRLDKFRVRAKGADFLRELGSLGRAAARYHESGSRAGKGQRRTAGRYR